MKVGGDPSPLFHEDSEKKYTGSIQTVAGEVNSIFRCYAWNIILPGPRRKIGVQKLEVILGWFSTGSSTKTTPKALRHRLAMQSPWCSLIPNSERWNMLYLKAVEGLLYERRR